jgi:hypothetical protein
MKRFRKWFAIAIGIIVLFVVWMLFTGPGHRVQFMAGGALVNVGYRMQDHLDAYDFVHEHEITPEQVWNEIIEQNAMSAAIRDWVPRTPRHALVAMVVCMDARIDTNELTGDTRHYYYIVRTAGSILSEREEEMLELAVANGVKVIVLTTHSDCAAEKVAASPEKRVLYPALAEGVDERDKRVKELLARPAIAEKIAAGELLVKSINIDTMTERMLPK